MVKCVDCGFLAMRDKETRELCEAERNEKGNIIFPCRRQKESTYQALISIYDNPICFAMAKNLNSEYTMNGAFSRPSADLQESTINEILKSQRDCNSFIKLIQGLTPKEHREMLYREWMLKYQADREKEDKDFRFQMAKDEREWRSKQDKRLVFIAGGFVILGALIGALAVIFH